VKLINQLSVIYQELSIFLSLLLCPDLVFILQSNYSETTEHLLHNPVSLTAPIRRTFYSPQSVLLKIKKKSSPETPSALGGDSAV
jgi:hypothetical protein